MDTILQNPWLQGTAIGLLLLAGGVAIRILYHELKKWQDSYVALVKTSMEQNSQIVESIRQQTEVVEQLGDVVKDHSTLLKANNEAIEDLAKHFDLKSIISEVIREAKNN